MSTPPQQLYQLVHQGIKQLTELTRIYDEEKSAIEQHDAPLLQQALNQKGELLLAVQKNINQRNQLLTSAGHGADDKGFRAFCDALNPQQSELLNNAWQQLKDALDRVSALNSRNEQIVKRCQKNLEQLINIIRGQDPKTTLYNQEGGKGHYSGQNRLGKA
jgi:flagellar biosynthesis/type III secretory pathway chaperone